MTRPVWLLAWFLAACAATGAPDSTIEQKFTWYRYLAGDDLRAACAADGPTRFRFVYNAVFTDEVRALDLEAVPTGGRLESHRYRGARVLDIGSGSLLNVPDRAGVYLDAVQVDDLLDAITASGFAGPAEAGLILRSDSHYAVASGCRGGEFKLHGYPWHALGGLGYWAMLERLDPIGVPWPKPVDTGSPDGAIDDTRAEARESSEVFFVIELGLTGLRGVNEP